MSRHRRVYFFHPLDGPLDPDEQRGYSLPECAACGGEFDPEDDDDRMLCEECQVDEDAVAAPDLPVHDPTSQSNPFPARTDLGIVGWWVLVIGGSVGFGLALSWAVMRSTLVYLACLATLIGILALVGGVLGEVRGHRPPRRQVRGDAVYFHPCRKCPARCKGHFR